MSIVVPMKGFGGGGTSLNFKVVGNPQPENPKVNTIWVNTDVRITGWLFAPENPYAPDIYIGAGVTADYYINNAGVITSSTNCALTDKIPLPDNTVSITITANTATTSTVSHWFYDESGNAISHVLRTLGTVTYDVPDGAKSVQVSFRDEDTKSIIANIHAETGLVYFRCGASSPAEFYALKKNGIPVYPVSADQYVDGAWVEKTALSYQDGEWVSWIPNIILFDNGTKDSGLSFTNSYGTTTFSGNYIVCKLTTADETYRAVTKNTYDLTDYNTICLKWTGLPSYTSFGIEVQKNGTPVSDAVSYSGNGTLNLNVSALKGKHNLCLRMYSGTANKTANVTYFAILV